MTARPSLLAFACLPLALACANPLPPVGESSSSGQGDITSTGPGSTTTPQPTTLDSSGSDTTAGSSSSSGTSTGPNDTTAESVGAGFCDLTCKSSFDCPPNGGTWECNEGFCDYVAPPPCDDTTCPPVSGAVCADVDGQNLCVYACMDDTMCAAGFTECTGTDDAGNTICQPLPTEPCGGVGEGEPCGIKGSGQYGTCTDGVCVCDTDAECTVDGYACRPAT